MKDLEISKELLSEVLGNKKILTSKNEILCSDKDILLFDNKCHYLVNINVYAFAFMCKEWAFSKGYTIITEFVNQNGVFSYVVSNKQSIENYGYLENIKVLNYIPHNKTEYEAIIKACEFVLKEINENR